MVVLTISWVEVMVNIFKITSKYIKLNFGCKHAKHKIKIDNLIFFNKESNETISKKKP